MKLLENDKRIEVLKDHIQFYIPTENANKALEAFVSTVTRITGGATLHAESRGLWINNMAYYDEPVKVLEVYCNMNIHSERKLIDAFMLFGQMTRQHSVALAHNDKMYIVEVKR